MSKFLIKPQICEAVRWQKDGDHKAVTLAGGGASSRAAMKCSECGYTMGRHGYVDVLGKKVMVCPGDYIVTQPTGDYYPCAAKKFEDMTQALSEPIIAVQLPAAPGRN